MSALFEKGLAVVAYFEAGFARPRGGGFAPEGTITFMPNARPTFATMLPILP